MFLIAKHKICVKQNKQDVSAKPDRMKQPSSTTGLAWSDGKNDKSLVEKEMIKYRETLNLKLWKEYGTYLMSKAELCALCMADWYYDPDRITAQWLFSNYTAGITPRAKPIATESLLTIPIAHKPKTLFFTTYNLIYYNHAFKFITPPLFGQMMNL